MYLVWMFLGTFILHSNKDNTFNCVGFGFGFVSVWKSYSWMKSMLLFYFIALKSENDSGVVYFCRQNSYILEMSNKVVQALKF